MVRRAGSRTGPFALFGGYPKEGELRRFAPIDYFRQSNNGGLVFFLEGLKKYSILAHLFINTIKIRTVNYEF